MSTFKKWLAKVAKAEKRLYYRDQTPETLTALVQLVHNYQPTIIVELGTCSGMSLRAWLAAKSDAKIYAVDLSFDPLIKSLDILPADLSKVTGIKQDILTVNFASLWSSEDRVIFYMDAHDLPEVHIMSHVLNNVVPLLPIGSIVAVDDLWQSPFRLTQDTSYDFYLNTICPEFDPIIYRELSYAPYWKGGSFAGFLEVIPLMKWCNEHSVVLNYASGVKMGHFHIPQPAQPPVPSLSPEVFSRLTGVILPKPLAGISVFSDSAAARSALQVCSRGVELFEADLFGDAYRCFEEARRIHPETRGATFASAICLVRTGDFANAIKLLEFDLQGAAPHSNSAIVLNDIKQWVSHHKEQQQSDDTVAVTIFTTAKSFEGHFGVIQHNAISSWTRLSIRPRIILFGNEPGSAELARELSLVHVPEVRCNEQGTPLISDMFEKAQSIASSFWVCYINADIILLEDFSTAVAALPVDRQILAIGRRWDFNIINYLDFSVPKWDERLIDMVKSEGQLHSNSGIDYFIFNKNSLKGIPDFAVGRPGWDNWLLWHVRNQGGTIIDATQVLTAIHQEHSYVHLNGGIKEYSLGDESRNNQNLGQGKVLMINHADYLLEPDGTLLPKQAQEGMDFDPEFFIRSKFDQALAAQNGDRFSDSLDHLENVQFHASYFNVDLPEGFHFRKAALYLQLDKNDEALAEAQNELVIFPDCKEARALKQFLETLSGKLFDSLLHKSAAHDTEPQPHPSCLFVNTFYPRFLADFYQNNPQVFAAAYQVQLVKLRQECFGDSDFYSEGLKQQGWFADDLIVNALPLQATWGREHVFFGTGLTVAVEQIRRVRPDVLYLQDLSLASRVFIEAVRPHTTLIVAQIASPVPAEAHLEGIDIVVSSFPHFVERFRSVGVTAYYQPLAFEPRVLQSLVKFAYDKRPVGCSFVGGISPYHGNGYQLLETLAVNVPIDFWGYGAETLPPESAIRKSHHGEVWGREMFYVLGASKITVNRHIDVAENYANNMRMFEATGCGALLITDYKDNLNELFDIGKEVVAYRSPEECVELIKYYLGHPDEAEAIAKAGQERTLREHSYRLRMVKTAEMLERHLRYKREKGTLQMPERISDGYQEIVQSDITQAMQTAWKNSAIPLRQRALVQYELDAMYHGNVPNAFKALVEIMKPVVDTGTIVLEIGCASGYYYEILEYLLNKRIRYTGVDYSDAMIEMAKDYYPNTTFISADGAMLSFTDRQFSIVISSCVLLHVPNWQQHVRETIRVADNYIIASRTPVCKKSATRFMKKFAYGIETVELIFNEGEFVREFILNGLELADVIQYQGSQDVDEYQVTYLFRRP
jgi:SAM-dependent methyltransferase/tetratricopeptide (TPR) repeat protein